MKEKQVLILCADNGKPVYVHPGIFRVIRKDMRG